MIAVIDYDCGNLFSLKASLKALGIDSQLTRDPQVISQSDGVILPGVGAFGDAADKLTEYGLRQPLLEAAGSGKPFLGICLGMQLLFEKSYEYGEHRGLGLIKGYVDSLRKDIENPKALVPHMGWDSLIYTGSPSPLLDGIEEGTFVYFVHSFYAKDCQKSLKAYASYEGVQVPALVQEKNVFGTQYHPEKSGQKGLVMLKNFARLCGETVGETL